MCKRMMSFPVSHYHNKPCDKIKIEEIEPDDPPDELDQEPKKNVYVDDTGGLYADVNVNQYTNNFKI